MPFSILIQAYPKTAAPVPHVQGPSLQGMFLQLIAEIDPALNQRLHEDNRYRPYTLSPLRIGDQDREFDGFRWPRHQDIRAGTPCALRVTLLEDAIFPTFSRYFLDHPEPTFRLGEMEFAVTNVLATADAGSPWSDYCPYPELIDRASQTDRRISVQFLSPTSFDIGDVDMPLPIPRLVFQSWRKRFAEFYQVAFLPEFEALVEQYTGISNLRRLETQLITVKQNVKLQGFTGRVMYDIARKAPSDLIFQLNLLADYAFFCGTGKRMAVGMGQTIRVKSEK
jgi:CRISPR-associated endoribonuclease Cas6